jgi:hypothetical protein
MQTSIDWLKKEFERYGSPTSLELLWETFDELIEHAKEMHKQEIMEAFKHGELPPLFVNLNAEQYYSETFKKD